VPIPAPLAAPLLAVLLAGVLALATPAVLRRLPVPPDEVDVAPFSELATPGFRFAAFCCSAVAGAIAFGCLPPAHWPAWVGLVTLGALLGLIDLHTGFLPLRLTYLAAALAVVGAGVSAWLLADWRVVAWSAGAGALAAAFFWLVWRFSSGLGFGDVRLAGLIGIVIGTGGGVLAFWSFLLGTLVGAAWGLVARWLRGTDAPFPYGPALLLGPLLAVVVSRLVLPG
jgi:leader peptidase (prepilin peptidase)/N-methyltransferase